MQEIKKYPYDDDFLRYDYEEHRYVLTEKALLVKMGINFNNMPADPLNINPSDRARLFCEEVSEEVYLYILSESANSAWLQWELATIPALRDVVKAMLLAQAKYDIKNGHLDTYSGIDAYKGKIVDRKDIQAASIAPNVEQMAYAIQPSIGRCLKTAVYFGATPPPFAVPDPDDDTKVIALY